MCLLQANRCLFSACCSGTKGNGQASKRREPGLVVSRQADAAGQRGSLGYLRGSII